MQVPKARKISYTHVKHDHHREDPYHWLSQRDHDDVIAYLEEENAFYERETAHTKGLQEQIFNEIKGRLDEDDESVPYFFNGYWYQKRMREGKSYPIYIRRKGSLEAKEEILFDVNQLAEGHDYYHLTGMNISPDNRRATFSVDTVGRRQYKLFHKDLKTDEIKDTGIDNVTGRAVWAADNETLFYTRKDPTTLRSYRVYRKTLAPRGGKEKLVYEEHDERFNVGIGKSKSQRFLYISCSSSTTDEIQYLEADRPKSEFKVFATREKGREYAISHHGDDFYILTNADGAKNFKVDKCPVGATSKENWKEVIPHRQDVLLEGLDIFNEFLVVSDRFNGLNRIRIISEQHDLDYFIRFDNEAYTAFTAMNLHFDTDQLIYQYTSLTTPPSTVRFNMQTREKTVLKQQRVLDDSFNPEDYTAVREWATAEDGTKIPISLVYKTDLKKENGNPLLQYGYGSYGATIDPYFSISRLSLLDRGFVFAIAHVRGGEYLGREWYEQGKMLQKNNTFTDFIACTEHLIAKSYSDPSQTYASGGSAGGLLMGAVMNMAPHLYRGVLAAVPFVDVVTTMLDESIPLTTGEYDEWGNPNDREYYEYMLKYSPYDNVQNQDYPAVFVTTGYHDSQVQYWEPAKWVARLRERNTSDHPIYFHTDMKSGHSGSSDRYKAIREVAKDFAFLLDCQGIKG